MAVSGSTRPSVAVLCMFVLVGACAASTGVGPTVETLAPAAGGPATGAAALVELGLADEHPAPFLVVGHRKWLGFLTLVRIYKEGGEYLLVSDRVPDGTCHLRRWRNVSAGHDDSFDRWFTILDPKRLGVDDECHKSARDGSSWMVGAPLDRGWIWRSRQQNGVESATYREFAGACSGIMALLGMSCRGPGCFTGDEREHGISCP